MKRQSIAINPTSERVQSRRQQEIPPRFPFGKLFGWMAGLIIGGMFVYRLSETGGRASQTACLWALAVSLLSGLAGLIPVYKAWGKELFWVLIGVFLSGSIRLLIGFLSVVIIVFFIAIERIQFVGFLSLFYAALLSFDTWLALWVLRNTKVEKGDDQETAIHGNIWDILSRHRRPA